MGRVLCTGCPRVTTPLPLLPEDPLGTFLMTTTTTGDRTTSKMQTDIRGNFFQSFVVPTIENGEELCIRLLEFFSTQNQVQNQVPQIMLGMVRVIYDIKTLSVVFSLSRKTI